MKLPVPSSQTFATQEPQQLSAAREVKTNTQEIVKPEVVGVGTLAATGSTQANAAPVTLAKGVTQVTGADGTKGVLLPKCEIGTKIRIYNVAAANLKVYPHSGGDINDGTQNAALAIEDKSLATFINLDGTTWAASYVVAT